MMTTSRHLCTVRHLCVSEHNKHRTPDFSWNFSLVWTQLTQLPSARSTCLLAFMEPCCFLVQTSLELTIFLHPNLIFFWPNIYNFSRFYVHHYINMDSGNSLPVRKAGTLLCLSQCKRPLSTTCSALGSFES